MAHMAHADRAGPGPGPGPGRVLAHMAHALVLRGQRGPAPWCCAASAALRPGAARPARPCALVLRPGSAEAGVAGPSG